MSIEDRAKAEIEALHVFFVGWFSGSLPLDAFESGFMQRFDSAFLLIPPEGRVLALEDLASGIQSGHGSNPDFRIAIRNVQVRRQFDGNVLCTYEEWQRNAKATEPPDNARVATVLFKEGDPLKWLHVHETTMPDDLIAQGTFDF